MLFKPHRLAQLALCAWLLAAAACSRGHRSAAQLPPAPPADTDQGSSGSHSVAWRCGNGVVESEYGEECEGSGSETIVCPNGVGARLGRCNPSQCKIDRQICQAQVPDDRVPIRPAAPIVDPEDAGDDMTVVEDAGPPRGGQVMELTCTPGSACTVTGRGICGSDGKSCVFCSNDVECMKAHPGYGVCTPPGYCVQCDAHRGCAYPAGCVQNMCSVGL